MSRPDEECEGADGMLAGDLPPLIPPGKYSLRFHGWETRKYLNRSAKVVLHFTVIDQGPHFGTKLTRWYNVRGLIGRPRVSGRFIVGWSGDLYREYMAIKGLVRRRDRIALSAYKTMIMTGFVETVIVDRNQKKLPDAAHYSVLRSIGPGET